MLTAFQLLGKTLKALWDDLFYLVLMNLFTMLCMFAPLAVLVLAFQLSGTEPNLAVFFTLAVLVSLLPFGGAAWVALYHVTCRIANDYAISWEHYFAAFRTHFRKAWLFGVLSFFISVAIPVNAVWYRQFFGDAVWVSWVQGMWLALGLFWMAISFYLPAFFAEQETKSWRTALRNSVIVAAANPIFTLTLLLLGGVLIGLTILIGFAPFVLFGLAAYALLASEAVANRVNAFRARTQDTGSKTSQHV